MKAALIPPIPHLEEFGRGDTHLTLSHLLDDPDYKRHYRSEAERGSYVILDNSAHEFGSGQEINLLLDEGLELGAQEIVCPDVLFDAHQTVERARKAFQCVAGRPEVFSQMPHRLKLMVVPQAKTAWEWNQCWTALARDFTHYFGNYPFTLGVSKDYEVFPGGLSWLITKYVLPLRSQYNFSIHLLGWGRKLWQLSELGNRFPWIRSTDSAKPFGFAYHRISLHTLSRKLYPGRPENYFHLELSPEQLEIARVNVEMFYEQARGPIHEHS